jgi:hypothetical protein
VVAACSDSESSDSRFDLGHSNNKDSPPSAAIREPSVDKSSIAVQTCERRLVGEGGSTGRGDEIPDSDWPTRSVVVGPVGFLAFDAYSAQPPDYFDPKIENSGAYDGFLVTVIVRAGRSATITIEPDVRKSVLFLDTASTEPLQGSHPTLADGIPAITLQACAAADTAFGIGMIAYGARCVPLSIGAPDASETYKLTMSLGKGACR